MSLYFSHPYKFLNFSWEKKRKRDYKSIHVPKQFEGKHVELQKKLQAVPLTLSWYVPEAINRNNRLGCVPCGPRHLLGNGPPRPDEPSNLFA